MYVALRSFPNVPLPHVPIFLVSSYQISARRVGKEKPHHALPCRDYHRKLQGSSHRLALLLRYNRAVYSHQVELLLGNNVRPVLTVCTVQALMTKLTVVARG